MNWRGCAPRSGLTWGQEPRRRRRCPSRRNSSSCAGAVPAIPSPTPAAVSTTTDPAAGRSVPERLPGGRLVTDLGHDHARFALVLVTKIRDMSARGRRGDHGMRGRWHHGRHSVGGVRNKIAGVLLAAGEGTRLGGPKALVEVAVTRLVDRGVALLREGGTAPVVVVTGAVDVPLLGAITVHNPDWRTGMASSLAAGLRAVPDSCAAAVIALVDQPLIAPNVVRRLIAAYLDGAGIAVATYGGKLRNPVLLARPEWAGVLALSTGDVGARPYLDAHPDLVTAVECGDVGRPDDIDTPEDLARVSRALASAGSPPAHGDPGPSTGRAPAPG